MSKKTLGRRTTSLFAALDAQTGMVFAETHRHHRSIEFRKFLDRLDEAVPRDLDVHLILDNYGTHKTPLIQDWLAKRPHFIVHLTPTYSSWLNLVERWFAELTTKQLRRGAHRSVRELEAATQEFLDATNDAPTPFIWTKTAGRHPGEHRPVRAAHARRAPTLTYCANHCYRTLASGNWTALRAAHLVVSGASAVVAPPDEAGRSVCGLIEIRRLLPAGRLGALATNVGPGLWPSAIHRVRRTWR